jgi:hypothetical protein
MQYSQWVRVGHSDPEERGGIVPYEVRLAAIVAVLLPAG